MSAHPGFDTARDREETRLQFFLQFVQPAFSEELLEFVPTAR